MKKLMMKLLLELLKDSKRSDRKIARILGVSQPTITRTRNRLVEEGVIQEFTIIPDLVKIGYEIMAISCVKTKNPMTAESSEESKKWMKKYPNIIFAANAEGMGKNGVMISLHKSYTEYSKFVREHLLHWGKDIRDYDTMLISLKGIIAKPLSLRYLAEEKSSED
ncbi:MAG: Lrp/AsnC family transcriptional regulator [Candidatus Bathyarchaeia archaeon]